MGPGPGVIRAVFDTNIVVSVLLFGTGRLTWLRKTWREGTIVPLVSRATTEELVVVLQYPKFRLDKDDREELLGDFLPHAEVVRGEDPASSLPRCRDADDQKFLDLAHAAQADALVTGDRDLLACRESFDIPIRTPAELREWLGLEGVD